ncbi:MAG: DUF2795 domain-containing protein [Chloroflexota bacterium]
MGDVNPVQVQKFLSNVDYPADKRELVETARARGADENVLETLQKLPDEQYETPADVSEAISGSR